MPLLKDDSSAVVNHLGRRADRTHRVRFVHQKEASDDGVDGFSQIGLVEGFGFKVNSIEALFRGAPSR